MSEALLFAEHGENMLCTKIVLNVRNNFCTQHVLPRFELGIFMYWTCNSMNNLLSYCGLVDAKIRASDKDLPVQQSVMVILSCLAKKNQNLNSRKKSSVYYWKLCFQVRNAHKPPFSVINWTFLIWNIFDLVENEECLDKNGQKSDKWAISCFR